MSATMNHVSVHANDLDEAVHFYTELLGFTVIPSPNFGSPVRWMRIGALQLHLFTRPSSPGAYHHFGVAVTDFPQVYARAQRMAVIDAETYGHHLFELPDGAVQLYVRDPSGNLVEIICPDAGSLPASLRAEVRRLEDLHAQGAHHRSATLFLDGCC